VDRPRGLEDAGNEAPPPEPGGGQLYVTGLGEEHLGPVLVALVTPGTSALMTVRPDLGSDPGVTAPAHLNATYVGKGIPPSARRARIGMLLRSCHSAALDWVTDARSGGAPGHLQINLVSPSRPSPQETFRSWLGSRVPSLNVYP
jgi:hypothetical protein